MSTTTRPLVTPLARPRASASIYTTADERHDHCHLRNRSSDHDCLVSESQIRINGHKQQQQQIDGDQQENVHAQPCSSSSKTTPAMTTTVTAKDTAKVTAIATDPSTCVSSYYSIKNPCGRNIQSLLLQETSSSSPNDRQKGATVDDPYHADNHVNIVTVQKRKRWKKPAIKKPKRFGFGIRIHDDGYQSNLSNDDKFSSRIRSNCNEIRKGTGKQNRAKKERIRLTDLGTRTARRFQKSKASPNSAAPTLCPMTNNIKPHESLKKLFPQKNPPASKTFSKPKSFEKRLEELKCFHALHGHCEVPYRYAPNQQLSNWCSNVRYSYGMVLKGLTPTIKMTQERIDRLTELGFEFQSASAIKKAKKESEEKTTAAT